MFSSKLNIFPLLLNIKTNLLKFRFVFYWVGISVAPVQLFDEFEEDDLNAKLCDMILYAILIKR